jgi:hypothetical protein
MAQTPQRAPTDDKSTPGGKLWRVATRVADNSITIGNFFVLTFCHD